MNMNEADFLGNLIPREEIKNKDLFFLAIEVHPTISKEKATLLAEAFFETDCTYLYFAEVLLKLDLNLRGDFKQYAINSINAHIEAKKEDLRKKFKTIGVPVSF